MCKVKRSTERFLILSCLVITTKHDFDEKIAILIFNVEVLKWNTYTGIISRIWCVERLVAPWRLTSKGYQTGSLMGIFPWRNKARRKSYSLRPHISDVKAPHAFDLRWYNIHVIRKEVGREREKSEWRESQRRKMLLHQVESQWFFDWIPVDMIWATHVVLPQFCFIIIPLYVTDHNASPNNLSVFL